jgi:hypothetical protein
LIDDNKDIKHRHGIDHAVQKAALTVLTQSLATYEKSGEKEEIIKNALKDPLFKKHNTFALNPMRLLSSKPVRELKKQLKKEEKAPSLSRGK